MIKIAICDDSEYIRKQNEDLIVKYSIQRDLDCSIKQFETGEKLLEAVDEFDLIFLDYQFEDKGADGMEIARRIRGRNSDVTIIFLSAYTNVVFETFSVSAFRFLVKPLEEAKLFEAMDAYVEGLKKDNQIRVKASGAEFVVKEGRIAYLEADDKTCVLHFIDNKGDVTSTETLSALEEKVSGDSFFRCHKSFLVNMKHIDSFTHSDITLQNGMRVPVSRQKYKPFCEAYTDFLTRN